jgi:hypothetical protein
VSSWPLERIRPAWYWQAIAQLACSPHIRAVEVVALSGATLTRYTVERDRHAIRQLLEAIDLFYDSHVIPGIAPAPDPERDSAELVLGIPALPEGTVTARGVLRRHGDRYRRLVGHRKAWERREAPVRVALVAAIADSGVEVALGDGWKAAVTTGRDGRRSLRFSVNGEAPMG